MTKRLHYIDQIKGFAILLVVVGHLYVFFLQDDSVVSNIISSFHMHLFMCISGFVGYINNATPNELARKLTKRIFAYLVPLYIVGWILAIYTKFILGDNNVITGFVWGSAPTGNWYWYLKVLAIFTLSTIPISLLRNWCEVLIYTCVLYILFFVVWKYGGLIGYALNMSDATCFFPFYVIGVLCRRYNFTGLKINFRIAAFLAFSLYTFAFIINSDLYYINNIIKRFLEPTFAIICVYSTFRLCESTKSKILRGLEQIGIHSLDVYLFHYFFIFSICACILPPVCHMIISACTIISAGLVISVISILVGKILKSNRYIQVMLYGKF